MPLTDEGAEAELKAAGGGPLAQQLSLESEAQKKLRLKGVSEQDLSQEQALPFYQAYQAND